MASTAVACAPSSRPQCRCSPGQGCAAATCGAQLPGAHELGCGAAVLPAVQQTPVHNPCTHPGARDWLRGFALRQQRRERRGLGFQQHILRLKRAGASRAVRRTAQASDVGRVQGAARACWVKARRVAAQQHIGRLGGQPGYGFPGCLVPEWQAPFSLRTCSGASAAYQAALRGLSLMKRLRVALPMLQAAVCKLLLHYNSCT